MGFPSIAVESSVGLIAQNMNFVKVFASNISYKYFLFKKIGKDDLVMLFEGPLEFEAILLLQSLLKVVQPSI